ncbi:MAG: tetratricopeptide repeat protein [Oligoflexia bacterium]|nr:tetratricopeptide repeat protein [Oligoflexia bacterium]
MEAMHDFSQGRVKLPPIPTVNQRSEDLLRNALLLVDAGEYRLARGILGEILRLNPNHVQAIRWMGWCFKQDKDLDNALKCYEQLNLRSVTDQDLFELGELYYDRQQFQKAKDVWLDALGQTHSESPRLFDLHRCLGNAYLHLGDTESAEENYNKALVIRSQSDALMVNFGTLYFQLNEFNKALHYYKRAVELNPFNERAWMGVAIVARQAHDLEWSRSALLRSLDSNASHTPALKLLGQWALEDCVWDLAIERIQGYCSENTTHVELLNLLTELLLARGSIFEAELENSRVLILDSSNADAQRLKREIIKKRG